MHEDIPVKEWKPMPEETLRKKTVRLLFNNFLQFTRICYFMFRSVASREAMLS